MNVMTERKYHLHLFDGEAVGSTDGGASVTDTTTTAGEGGTENQPSIVYGKVDVNVPEDGQLGTDEGNLEPTPNLDEEFDELVKGKYKDQFKKRMTDGINRRFKNTADYEGQVNQYADAVAPLLEIYGLEAGDVEGLKEAIYNDEGLFKGYADESGLTTEDAMRRVLFNIDAKNVRAERDRLAQEKANVERINSMMEESEDIKESFPSFDLQMELQNERFSEAINRGYSVKDAFMLAHFNEILAGNNAYVQKQSTQNVVDNINHRAARPVENGLSNHRAVTVKSDPSKWTREDMMEVAKRVRNGETIKL